MFSAVLLGSSEPNRTALISLSDFQAGSLGSSLNPELGIICLSSTCVGSLPVDSAVGLDLWFLSQSSLLPFCSPGICGRRGSAGPSSGPFFGIILGVRGDSAGPSSGPFFDSPIGIPDGGLSSDPFGRPIGLGGAGGLLSDPFVFPIGGPAFLKNTL